LSWRGGGEGFGKYDYKFYKSKQPNVVDSFDRETLICPYGVSPTKLARVIEVHVLIQDLLKQCGTRIAIQEEKRSKFFEKLVGMKFNMED
jgi:hypothetical protein